MNTRTFHIHEHIKLKELYSFNKHSELQIVEVQWTRGKSRMRRKAVVVLNDITVDMGKVLQINQENSTTGIGRNKHIVHIHIAMGPAGRM